MLDVYSTLELREPRPENGPFWKYLGIRRAHVKRERCMSERKGGAGAGWEVGVGLKDGRGQGGLVGT